MNRSITFRTLAWALLVGWCLLFLRCETTEKSMVRAICFAQTDNGVQAMLVYQAPEASADASEASSALQAIWAEGKTLEQAIFTAQKALPQAADFRLCDYLLIARNTPETLLADYEQLVLERQWGRTAARVAYMETENGFFEEESENQCGFADELIGKLKSNSALLPRLYQHGEKVLVPVLKAVGNEVDFSGSMILRTSEKRLELNEQETELALLLKNVPGTRVLWLDHEPVRIRRCSVSVTLRKETVFLRLDCQLAVGEPAPTEAQKKQLEAESCQLIEELWAQGTDLLCLQQYSILQYGVDSMVITTKNACPQLQTDVNFLQF